MRFRHPVRRATGKLTDRVDLLAERGPDLGRPVVDRIHDSRHQAMKSCERPKVGRCGCCSFDPRRQAILLLGGDKTGEWNDWYEW